ncbi:MAG: hypothetical protein ACFFEY_02295 [Candidatus Thorarchaeota archaeon]
MVVNKKIITPEYKEDKEIVMDDLSNFKIDRLPKKKSRKSFITIGVYSYGSKGLQWHYFSKLIKKND